jgi:uncharacterized membrane protein
MQVMNPSTAQEVVSSSSRIASLDLLRGLVMVIMALDHVRDHFSNATYDPTNLLRTNPPLFFTRWITHFCAPVFILLTGTSAFLFLANGKTRGQLARFLAVRGVMLVIFELTVVSFAWTFQLSGEVFALQVIWALGWSMIALALLIFLPTWLIAVFGVVMCAGHNLLDGINVGTFPAWATWLVNILHVPRPPVLYPLIPWIGAMALGYVLGQVFLFEPPRRQRFLLILGFILTMLFILLRAINGYGDPAHWVPQRSAIFTLMSFLNTTKYPPSLLFLLMTLGPSLVLLALLEKASGWLANFFIRFGRVPLFYYVVHLYLIHILALLIGTASGYHVQDFLQPYFRFPDGYGFDLPTVYLVWLGLVLLLYPLCLWYGKRKKEYAWLRYF